MDKISVIISGSMTPGFTASAVRSIFHSTYRNIEVIVLDDGAAADFGGLNEEFENKIIYMRSASLSPAAQWNEGAEKASGEMLSFFEGKDISGRMRLELSVKKMIDDPGVGLVFCGMTYINSDDGFLQGVNLMKNFIPQQGLGKLFEGNYIASLSTTLMSRHVFEKAGRFDDKLEVNFEYDLYLRIAKRARIACINLPLLRYRMIPGGKSIGDEEWNETERRILNKHDVAVIADSLTPLYAKEDKFRVALGRILVRMGKLDDALLNFKRALTINRENADAYFQIGNYFYFKADFEQAYHWYNECLRLDPNHAGSRNNLGVLYYVSGSWDASEAEFDRARNINTNYLDPVFNLQCLHEKVAAERLRITGFRERNIPVHIPGKNSTSHADSWLHTAGRVKT